MTEHACPDAGILAAFAEGALQPEQRAEVERHVANCPECPAVIGEVIRFLGENAEENSEPGTPARRWWFAAAAIAAICIPTAVWRTVSTRDPLNRIRRVAAASPERAYEGRLHGFPHAHVHLPRADERPFIPIALQAETKRLAKHPQDANVLHARAVAALLSAKPREAVDLLQAAAHLAPNDAAIWNDLAVAEIARASLDDRTALPSALRAADRAATLSPSSPEAHYNRAIALERLGRDAEAAKAYRQALAQQTSGPWHEEIRDRLQRLETDR